VVKSKHSSFHLSFQVILRLLIFSLVVYFSILYFSQGKTNLPTISLPPLINFLPPSSQQTLYNLSSTPQAVFLQQKIDLLKSETADFPQKQIRDIQKAVVNKLYSNIIQNIDQP